jgi:hypothetical protein
MLHSQGGRCRDATRNAGRLALGLGILLVVLLLVVITPFFYPITLRFGDKRFLFAAGEPFKMRVLRWGIGFSYADSASSGLTIGPFSWVVAVVKEPAPKRPAARRHGGEPPPSRNHAERG